MAFDNLSEKLQNVFKNLRSKGRLTEEDVKAALKEVKIALLEADVNFKVVKGTQKVQREVYVVNAGFSPLVIHKVRCDNSAIQAHIKKTKLKPGQSTKLIIEADPMRAKSNTLISDLYIVSNDPGKPSQAIRVTAEFQ